MERQDRSKYGDKRTDVIARSFLSHGVGFVVGNLDKYSQRIVSVSKMPILKRWYYKLVLSKGGSDDGRKIHVYLERLHEYSPVTYEKWVLILDKKLDGIS
jgi:hypothetical protein